MSFSSLIPSFLPGGISSRFDFQALLDQRGRLLQVHTALPTLALIPERMVMREAVSQPFELLIDCLSTSAHFELKQLVGEQVSVGLLQPNGSYKPWHGYVFEAAQLGADGALARYRLVLKPWLCSLAQRRDAFVFQDLTAREIIEDLFADYPEAQYRFELSEPLRRRSLCTQYRESDLEFVHRLLAEEGLSYHFEHAGDGAELLGASSALHTLVITDRTAPRPDLGSTRFAAQHPTAFIQGQKDAITAFKTQRRLQPNAVALGSWNYRELVGSSATLATALEQGDLPKLEVYDGSGAYRYENTAHAQRATELALGALELQTKTFEGQGSTRHFEAGRQFSLIDHPLYGAGLTAGLSEGLSGVIKAVLDAPAAILGRREDNSFTILAVEHHAANNLGSEAAALLGLSAIERGGYRNQFHAAPAAAPVIPRFARKPTAPGAQTALVVGLDGEALTTDRDHRIKVQFPWQRGSNALAGGLAHDGQSPDSQGNAPGNEQSGTWVRVMSPQAGANWGAVFTPRIGTEVLVEFIEGDIDRPVITAALYNGQDRPPFSAGVDSGVNHPGTLSGIHSHSLDQSGFNQWVLDDATAQVRMRLLCSYSAAEVGLGHLIQQAAHTAQRGAWRGSGFEAATRAWASLRSAKGLLISTTARPGSYGSAQSTQMDTTEAVAQLKGAQDLAERLSQAAQTGQAQALTAHAESIPALIKTLDPEQDGKITAAINGQEAQKAQGRELSEPVEAPSTPTVLLDTPSSQAWLSDASIASYAGQDLARVSQGDQHETAAHTHATVAGQTVSLYTHAGGITAHAANGPVSLRAHTDELQILADKDVTILSVNGEIHINAQSKIELIGADSGVILDGGDITFVTPGTWEAKGAAQAMMAGESASAELKQMPDTRVKLFDEKFQIKDQDGSPLADFAYKATTGEGDVYRGITDPNGFTERIYTSNPSEIIVQADDFEVYEPNGRFDEQIKFLNANDTPLSDLAYSVKMSDGTVFSGITDGDGLTERIETKTSQDIIEATLSGRAIVSCCEYHASQSQGDSSLTLKISSTSTSAENFGSSVKTVATPADSSRPMTEGEISMSMLVFGTSIDYTTVKVHNGEYLWFGMQPDNTAMTPNGEIYFNPKHFKEDFSLTDEFTRHWFMHEMTHVWQHQLGYPVKWRGAVRIGLSYEYELDASKKLSDFNMEAQGNILADFFALTHMRYPSAVRQSKYRESEAIALYRAVLSDFLKNPSDKSSLPN